MKAKTKWHLIGDPAIRERLNGTLRVTGMSIVLGLACIGLGSLARVVVQILAW